MAITFLHAADVHLDSPLRGLDRYEDAPAEKIRGATRRAFDALIDLAIGRSVDFVVIAGDLYDGDWRDYNTGLHLARRFDRLREAGIPVFLIAGNHDAANKMTRSLRLPGNVRVLGHARAETATIDGLEVAIHGQSFASAAVTENLAAAYPRPRPGWFNLGMLHTAMGGSEGHERYAPCSLEDLRSRGYDYWALGHVHARATPCDDPPVVFPGNPQGRHVREAGEKGCVIATVGADGSCAREFARLDVVSWARRRVDLTDASTESAVFDAAAAAIDGLLGAEADPGRLTAARVVLHGSTALDGRLRADPERWANEVRRLAIERGGDRLWVEKVEVQTRSSRPVGPVDGPIEELRELIASIRADPAQLADLIGELGDLSRRLPHELTGDEEGLRLDDPAWVAALLDDVQPTLLDLLMPGREPSRPSP